MPDRFSRRAFLRLASVCLLSPAMRRWQVEDVSLTPSQSVFYGRVIFIYATLYSRPSIQAATGIIHPLESILPIYGEVLSADAGPRRQHWYETDGGYVYATNVQPVQNKPNRPQDTSTPQLGEVTVPFADAFAGPTVGSFPIYRLYYSTIHWVQRLWIDVGGEPWYELFDDRAKTTYFAPAAALRLIAPEELLPLSPNVRDKRIQIDTTQETITAFEQSRPVFTTRISSGGNFGPGKDFRTPLGDFQVYRKRPSRHMAAGDGVADDAYDLPGVPWVSYFNGGMAIHGTYWHNDFGYPWSHGCINLLSQDAKWFYRWTTPGVVAGQEIAEAPGTRVTVV